MDFAPLQKGILELALGAVFAFNTSQTPVPSSTPDPNLQYPSLIESKNLPDEQTALMDLNSLTKSEEVSLKLVTKEVEEEKIVTVEQPPIVFTVLAPTPKPSPSEKPEESEDEKSDEAKPETSASPKPSGSPKPSEKPEEKKEEPKPSTTPVGALSSPNAEILFTMTNDHRSKIGKPAFEKEERLCKIAEQRAPQVNGELASGALHKGFKELNLPYWATENIAAYMTMKENFNFLVTDYIHRKAIESDHKYSCTACVGTSCSQIFSSFVSK